jgi:hypothetical protein
LVETGEVVEIPTRVEQTNQESKNREESQLSPAETQEVSGTTLELEIVTSEPRLSPAPNQRWLLLSQIVVSFTPVLRQKRAFRYQCIKL